MYVYPYQGMPVCMHTHVRYTNVDMYIKKYIYICIYVDIKKYYMYVYTYQGMPMYASRYAYVCLPM